MIFIPSHLKYHIEDIKKILTSSTKSPFDLWQKVSTLSVLPLQKNSLPSRPLSSRKLLPSTSLLISAMEEVPEDRFQEQGLVALFRERDLVWMDEPLWILGKNWKWEKWKTAKKKLWWKGVISYHYTVNYRHYHYPTCYYSWYSTPKPKPANQPKKAPTQQRQSTKPAETVMEGENMKDAIFASVSTSPQPQYIMASSLLPTPVVHDEETLKKKVWHVAERGMTSSFVVCRRNCVRLPLSRKSGIFWMKSKLWK